MVECIDKNITTIYNWNVGLSKEIRIRNQIYFMIKLFVASLFWLKIVE